MSNFKTLKLSRPENFRDLKLSNRVSKFSNLESLRAIQLSNNESLRVRIYSIRALKLHSGNVITITYLYEGNQKLLFNDMFENTALLIQNT